MNRKSERIKEEQISKAMLSIENRVRHVYNQGYEQGLQEHLVNKSDDLVKDLVKDAISRQAVIERLKKEDKILYTPTGLNYLISAIQDLPSVKPQEQKWIPVSEKLPEDIKPVIVTWKNTDPKSYYQYIVGKHFIGTAHYKNGKWFWYSSVTEDLLAEYGRCDCEEFDEAIDVIAWMPLPEPYKAESEGINETE